MKTARFSSALLMSFTLLLAACGQATLPAADISTSPAPSAASSTPASPNTQANASTPLITAQSVPVPSTLTAFTFLSPLNQGGSVDLSKFDPSLTDLLTVNVCLVSGSSCTSLASLTSTSGASERLRLDAEAGQYHTNWSAHSANLVDGQTIRISVSITTLTLGSIDLTVDKSGSSRSSTGQLLSFNGKRTLPITFSVNQSPVIRAHALKVLGKSADRKSVV